MSKKQIKKDVPFVFHFRNVDNHSGVGLAKVLPCGGVTIVFDPKVCLFGVARCNATDNYNKKRGRQIASGRIKKAQDTGWLDMAFVHYHPENALYVEDVQNRAHEIAEKIPGSHLVKQLLGRNPAVHICFNGETTTTTTATTSQHL